jgi:hypothetical protein
MECPDVVVPDYPPPSFLEAISTTTSTATVQPLDTLPTVSVPAVKSHPTQHPAMASDSSLEIIDLDSLQTPQPVLTRKERVKTEYRRRAVEVSTPPPSSHDTANTTASESRSEGRPGRGVLDSDSEAEAESRATFAAASTKRKHLVSFRGHPLLPSSLIPVRTSSAHPPNPLSSNLST